MLHCPRCASSVPAVCASCGPTRPRIVRPGVARARDDLAALTGLEVAEIGRAGTGPDGGLPDAPVLVGTEAVLHRAASASLVVFLDFDHELLAPRYRAGEQALALLALASRVVGGRRRRRARRGQDAAAGSRGPGRSPACRPRPARRCRGASPGTAPASPDNRTRTGERGRRRRVRRAVGVLGPGRRGGELGRRPLPRPGARDPKALADALASAGQPAPGTRIEVDPRQV